MKLLDYRIINNLTLKDLSEKTNLSVSILSKLERGKYYTPLKTIEKYENLLSLKLNEKIQLEKNYTLEVEPISLQIRQHKDTIKKLKEQIIELEKENRALKKTLTHLNVNLYSLKNLLEDIPSLFVSKRKHRPVKKIRNNIKGYLENNEPKN